MSVANESSQEAHNMRHESHSGPGIYIIIWVALMILTVVTVVTGRMHMPDWGLALALTIASVKGGMVALYFMHLSEHKGANRVVFACSMLFVVVLLLFTLFDIGTRFRPALAPNGKPIQWPVATGQSLPYEGGDRPAPLVPTH